MGISAQDILASDPAALERRLLNPQGTPAGAITGFLGRGVGNLLAGRGFTAEDPALQRVSKIRTIQSQIAQSGETDPNKLATMFADELAKDPDLAPFSLQVRAQLKPNKAESKVVPPGAAVLDANGKEIYRNPKETPQNIKTVDLGDRVEYYQGDSQTPFKTEKKGEAPTTQFRRELEASKREEAESRQAIAAQASIAHGTKVLQDVSETKNLVSPWTTGAVGGVARFLPQTEARKLNNKIQTIKANLGFDRLQQMRDASPTGGALGQVAVQEINFLQSVVATLDQLESQDDILNALGKIEEHYTNWLNAVRGRIPQGTEQAGQPAPQATAQPAPATTTVVPKGVTVRKVQ